MQTQTFALLPSKVSEAAMASAAYSRSSVARVPESSAPAGSRASRAAASFPRRSSRCAARFGASNSLRAAARSRFRYAASVIGSRRAPVDERATAGGEAADEILGRVSRNVRHELQCCREVTGPVSAKQTGCSRAAAGRGSILAPDSTLGLWINGFE